MSKQDKTEKMAYETMEKFGVLTRQVETVYGGANIKFLNIKGIATGKFLEYLQNNEQVNERGEYIFTGAWTISTTPSESHFPDRMDKFFKQDARKWAVKYQMNRTPLSAQQKPAVEIKEVPRELEGPIQKFIVTLQGISFAEMCIEATDRTMAWKFANDRLADFNTHVNWRTEIESVEPGEVRVIDSEEQTTGETKGNFYTVRPDRDFLNKHYTTTYTKRKENI